MINMSNVNDLLIFTRVLKWKRARDLESMNELISQRQLSRQILLFS